MGGTCPKPTPIPLVWRSLRGTWIPQPCPGATSELPQTPQAAGNTWNCRYNAPAIDGSHCYGGTAARGFISPAVIKFRACWHTLQLCPPLAHQAGHLRVRLPLPISTHSAAARNQALEKQMSSLASVKSSFRHCWPKGSPDQEAKDNKKMQLWEAGMKQIPAVCAEIMKAGVHCSFGLCPPWKGQ